MHMYCTGINLIVHYSLWFATCHSSTCILISVHISSLVCKIAQKSVLVPPFSALVLFLHTMKSSWNFEFKKHHILPTYKTEVLFWCAMLLVLRLKNSPKFFLQNSRLFDMKTHLTAILPLSCFRYAFSHALFLRWKLNESCQKHQHGVRFHILFLSNRAIPHFMNNEWNIPNNSYIKRSVRDYEIWRELRKLRSRSCWMDANFCISKFYIFLWIR